MRDTIGCMTAKTTAERQRDFRARKKAEQSEEVRGIFAPKRLHDEIKAYAKKLQEPTKTA